MNKIKRLIKFGLPVLVSCLVAGFVVANTFPTSLNEWSSGDIIEPGWANALEEKIGIDNSTSSSSHDYKLRHLPTQEQDWTFGNYDISIGGDIDVTGDVGGTTIGGITEANLLDKTAAETITADWTFQGLASSYAMALESYSTTAGYRGEVVGYKSSQNTVGYAETANTDALLLLGGKGVGSAEDSFDWGAYILIEQDGAAGANYVPAMIKFHTGTASAAPAERVRVDSAGIITMANQSRARAYLDTEDQTIASGSWQVVGFNAENYDEQNEFDTTTHRFTATVSGYYQINAWVQWQSSVIGTWHQIAIREGGDTFYASDRVNSWATSTFTQSVSDVIYLAAGEYIELVTYQNSGGGLDIAQNSSISVHKQS